MAFYRSTSVYIPGSTRARAKAGAEVRMGAREAAGIGMGVLLPSVGAPETFLASSSLPVGRELRRVRVPDI